MCWLPCAPGDIAPLCATACPPRLRGKSNFRAVKPGFSSRMGRLPDRAMDNQKSFPPSHSSSEGSERELLPNPVVEQFFAGLKHDMRRPAPGQEAIAAALQAIQKVAANSDTEEALAAEARVPTDRAVCASCGGDNPATNRFCARCGVPLPQMAPRSESMKESAEERISSVP